MGFKILSLSTWTIKPCNVLSARLVFSALSVLSVRLVFSALSVLSAPEYVYINRVLLLHIINFLFSLKEILISFFSIFFDVIINKTYLSIFYLSYFCIKISYSVSLFNCFLQGLYIGTRKNDLLSSIGGVFLLAFLLHY
ncbi:hypothetical protein PUN28_010474 [Cardiocondyla obscurior]|uniref:Uncharacterized protein n=1 Tax=Cardiocondyla obscurior TaxID=286306 RepID=A0AAW2FJK8_9HYME